MLDSIAAFLIRSLNRILHVLPIGFNLWLGRQLGFVIYLLSPKRARIAYANLKAAFQGEKSPAELSRITLGVYRNMAQVFAEILSMTKINARYIEKYVKVRDLERIDMCSKHDKGMILLSAHFGNWELSTVTSYFKGYPLHLLARDQKMQKTYELMNILRESKGNIVIRKGADVKNLFRVLRGGKGVGILGDQNAGPNGMLLDLFGRPASTAVGPFRIAQKCGSYILPAFIHRKKGPYHEVILEEPFSIGGDESLKKYMRRYNDLLEKHVRQDPDQWLWMHKKWKMTDIKKILLLDDGKAGHLKQTLAVLKQIKLYRESEGQEPDKIKHVKIKADFRSSYRKTLYKLLSPFSVRFARLHLRLMRVCLKERSYSDLSAEYADVVIGCGSSLAGLTYALSLENNCKSAVIMDPGPRLRGKFDLVVVPGLGQASVPPAGDNVLCTQLAPNLIDPSEISVLGKVLREEARIKGVCIGCLIGGDNRSYIFNAGLAGEICSAIQSAADASGASYVVTTSRRTSEDAERLLCTRMSADPGCAMFVSGREDRDEKTVEKILGASDVIVVSGESISMVSEAVSSGKPVIVFFPEKRSGGMADKYLTFAKKLREKGFVDITDESSLAEAIISRTSQTTAVKAIDDDVRLRGELYRLF